MDAPKAVAALSALAHDTRLSLFRLLVKRGPEGEAAGVLAEKLGIVPSSLTFHLQQLVHADLITQRRSSRHIIYAANFATMNGLLSYLSENCCAESAFADRLRPPACGVSATVSTPRTARKRAS
jgi:ArsR family transcriptional regulator, arsenate/arsenite/antimonite-responsive transcriptional repressor